MTIQTPQPGDVVTITTRHVSNYYKNETGYDETTYENVRVLQPLPWLQAHEFCIPADGQETKFGKVEVVERMDRAPEFEPLAMRYVESYVPSNTAPKFTTRVINMKNVVAINGEAVEQYQESIKQVMINSTRGGGYIVRVENGIGASCECKGFQFRGKCRHLQEAEKELS